MIPAPAELDADAWGTRRRAARIRAIVAWTSTGILLGGILPGLPMLFVAVQAPPLAGYVVGSLVVGAVGGVLMGVLRPIDRIAGWLRSAGRTHMIAPLSVLVGFVLGMIWGGLAGSAGGAAVVATFVLFEPIPGTEAGAAIVLGAVFGGPPGWSLGGAGVSIAAAVRSIQVRTGAPWWLPAVAAGAGAVTFFGWAVLSLVIVFGLLSLVL